MSVLKKIYTPIASRSQVNFDITKHRALISDVKSMERGRRVRLQHPAISSSSALSSTSNHDAKLASFQVALSVFAFTPLLLSTREHIVVAVSPPSITFKYGT